MLLPPCISCLSFFDVMPDGAEKKRKNGALTHFLLFSKSTGPKLKIFCRVDTEVIGFDLSHFVKV